MRMEDYIAMKIEELCSKSGITRYQLSLRSGISQSALSDIVKKKLTEYVDLLYQSAPECFCERLASNTFHVTLHDLSNSPVLQNVAGELFENELRVIEKKREIQQAAKTTLKLKSNYIFNMVDTSLVLGLYSADKDEYCQLMRLYSIFDDVKKLDYPFTPHITLA